MEMWGKTEEGLVFEAAQEAREEDSHSQPATPAISVRLARWSSHSSQYSSDPSDSPSSLDLCQACSVDISTPSPLISHSRTTTDKSLPLSRRFDFVFLSNALEEQPPPVLRALVRENLRGLTRGKEALVELRQLYRRRQHCPPVSAADRLPELCSFCGEPYEDSTKCENCLTILCLDCSGLYPGGRCLICRLRGLHTPLLFMRGLQCPICFEPAKAIRQWVVCARCKNTLCNGCNISWGRRCPFCRGINTLSGSS